MDGLTPAQRINQVLTEKKIQKKALADYIGIPPTTLNSWINRGGDFPASYVGPIAECLDIHPLWLINGQEIATPKIPDTYVELSEEEAFLLRTFRSLPHEGKIVVANKAVEELRLAKAEQGITSSATA